MVSAGINHTFFIDVNGSLWGMGRNGGGQLGDGSTTSRSSPVQIMSLGVMKVVTGNGHTLFLDENGTLRAMGWNTDGRLGDGSTTNRTSPVVVATGVTEIGAGEIFSHFIDANGTLWAFGESGHHRLGDGQDSVDRLSPVQIISGAAMNPKEVTFHTTIGGVIKGAGKHDFNATATLTAVPEPGYLFSGWSGGLSGTTNPAPSRDDPVPPPAPRLALGLPAVNDVDRHHRRHGGGLGRRGLGGDYRGGLRRGLGNRFRRRVGFFTGAARALRLFGGFLGGVGLRGLRRPSLSRGRRLGP